MHRRRPAAIWLWLLCLLSGPAIAEDPAEAYDFDDSPVAEPAEYPDWFKLSFLDLRDDLAEARADGKRGLILYFSQKHCAYCDALVRRNWGREDIARQTRDHFDVIALDIHGGRDLIDLDGQVVSERDYARRLSADFTPYLLFIDTEGRTALKLRGYYPPYRFRAALNYVTSGLYLEESFRDYLARADVPLQFDAGELNYSDIIPPPPHILARHQLRAERPLLVLFERPECHACDVLHTRVLTNPDIRPRLIEDFDLAQVNVESDAPVYTPDGQRLLARDWAEQLSLIYTPTLIFYDEGGREIIRIDSVLQFYRLGMVLDYIEGGHYLAYPNYQDWMRARSAGDVL